MKAEVVQFSSGLLCMMPPVILQLAYPILHVSVDALPVEPSRHFLHCFITAKVAPPNFVIMTGLKDLLLCCFLSDNLKITEGTTELQVYFSHISSEDLSLL